jgi:flagella basal body P-ring formation protein FlgA
MRIALAFCIALVAGPALAGPVTLRQQPVDEDGRVTFGDIFDGAGSAANVVIGTRTGPSVVFEAGQLQGLALRSGLQWANPRGLSRVVVREGSASPTAPAAVLTPVSAVAAASRPVAVRANPTVTSASAARPGATTDVLTYARNLSTGDVIQPEDVVWTTLQAHMAPGGSPQDADQVIGLSAKRALRAGAPVSSRDLASPQVIARNDLVEVAYIVGGVKLTVTGRATRNAAVGEAVSVLNTTSNRTIDAVATGPGQAIVGPAAQFARSNPQQFAAR